MGMTSASGQRFRIDVLYPDDPHHIRVTTVDRDSRLRITSLRQPTPNRIIIDQIGPFRFTKPLPFQMERTDDGIILSNCESDLTAYGDSMENAESDLQSEIEMAWEEYALEDDSKMDNVARKYKRWLLENVRIVQPMQ